MTPFAAVEVKFLMNIPKRDGDEYIIKKLYSYKFTGKPKAKTIIELEFYENKIVIVSFYTDGQGNKNNRYKIRKKYPGLVVLRIFLACLKPFYEININKDYCLIFHASNDLDDIREYNARMSAYDKFLDYYYPEFSELTTFGSISLNTFGMHCKEYSFKEEAQDFFKEFNRRVKEEIENPVENNQK
jgi:hypothetical protein